MKEMEGTSRDILKDNIEALGQLFPEAMEEGKVDFDKLKQLLGEYVDDDEERYSFKWNGKGRALRLSQTPSTGTLRPCKEESKDWDTTQNLYIEGDNLEVLKLLQKSYYGKVKMIYIDPPYNTSTDFVYKDDFTDNIKNYKKITGQVDEEGKKIVTNTESDGRFHTNWLNMMYPRLRLARNLLTADGVILMNIDENEVFNLIKICNEVFGESNDLGVVVWDKRNPKGDAKGISYQHEYILLFAKDKQFFIDKCKMIRPKKNAKAMIRKAKQCFNKIDEGYTLEDANNDYKKWLDKQDGLSGGERAYSKIDANGKVYQPVSMGWPNKGKAPEDYFVPLVHPVTGKNCPVPARGWRNPSATMKALLDNNEIIFGIDETIQPRRKYLLEENMDENIPSLIYYGGSDTDELDRMNIPFDTPKVSAICQEHIAAMAEKDSIIMDFFAGSSTTAHAVMQLNAEDGGNREFIMVQLPEPTDEKSEAYKAGYKNICEIGKERIRRAGEKIKAEVGETAENLDIGFKVFKLDTSNIKKWQPKEDVLTLLEESVSNFVPGRSEMDVVYEIMLKMGLDLTYPVEERKVGEQTVYVIGAGALMICLADGITQKTAEGIIKLKEEYEPEAWQVVVRDSGFASDEDKTNAQETLKAAGLDEGSFISI